MKGRKGHNCITDREARDLWRDYQHVMKDGNPLGLSFVQYVTARVNALAQTQTWTATGTSNAPWYFAQCGHSHPWGASCSAWTEA